MLGMMSTATRRSPSFGLLVTGLGLATLLLAVMLGARERLSPNHARVHLVQRTTDKPTDSLPALRGETHRLSWAPESEQASLDNETPLLGPIVAAVAGLLLIAGGLRIRKFELGRAASAQA
jgi:hypothetical protein